MANFRAIPAFTTLSPAKSYGEETNPAQAFTVGAAVYLDANNLVAECPVDPATILGFAASAAGKNPLVMRQVADNPAVLTDVVWTAWEGQPFWMSVANGPPTQANNQKAYGITKGADGVWQVDLNKVAATRVFVQYVDLDRNLVLVTVLAANRQLAP